VCRWGSHRLQAVLFNVKTLYAKQILKCDNGVPDIQTIRDKDLHIPGYFANHGGNKVYKIVAGSFKSFSKLFQRVSNFQPV